MKILIAMVTSVLIVLGLSIPSIDVWDMQHHGVLNFIGGVIAGTITAKLLQD
jgi:hypothetical protein